MPDRDDGGQAVYRSDDGRHTRHSLLPLSNAVNPAVAASPCGIISNAMAAEKTISTNRKAYYTYSIDEKVEAGIVLTGTEIKSIRAGKVSLAGSFAKPDRGELWLANVTIAQYDSGNRNNHEPDRPRKLLMHRDQINRLTGAVMEKGLTLVPLRLYIKNGLAKVEMGLARGKKLYDKRQTIAQREAKRDIERTLKTRRLKR